MSSESGPGPEVSRRLGYLLKHAQVRMTQLYAEALSPFGVDARELGVLLLLAGHEPASQQHAAQRLGVDRTTMVTVLDTLQNKGLVSRRPDDHDRRRNVVELTDAGHAVVRSAGRASDEAEQTLLAPLSPRDARHLRTALQHVVEVPRADREPPDDESRAAP